MGGCCRLLDDDVTHATATTVPLLAARETNRWYYQKISGMEVTAGVLLIYPSVLVPLYDAAILGNLFQGWCVCNGKARGASGSGGEEHLPEQPPALGGWRPLSRNVSSGGSHECNGKGHTRGP